MSGPWRSGLCLILLCCLLQASNALRLQSPQSPAFIDSHHEVTFTWSVDSGDPPHFELYMVCSPFQPISLGTMDTASRQTSLRTDKPNLPLIIFDVKISCLLSARAVHSLSVLAQSDPFYVSFDATDAVFTPSAVVFSVTKLLSAPFQTVPASSSVSPSLTSSQSISGLILPPVASVSIVRSTSSTQTLSSSITPSRTMIISTTSSVPTSPPVVTPVEAQSSTQKPIGAIIGGTIGGLSVISAFILLIFVFRRKASKRNNLGDFNHLRNEMSSSSAAVVGSEDLQHDIPSIVQTSSGSRSDIQTASRDSYYGAYVDSGNPYSYGYQGASSSMYKSNNSRAKRT